ncbi:protein-disulfide isomerase [Psychromicrobium silvestre]|uniref:Protein-disulfide isomerase n=1 Tax=Psychromicrobium silvestre TaxID=1645614 RepID=A0A7Y9S9H5_9MICC|nr:thioredoxin domain-containing protein [Psychromicrobium silvestre]NYE96307.1 protein-disulfide isomerase [Psychromicrobium silvestre]
MSSQNQPKMTKAERTAAAREQARLIREAAAKKQKRNGWLIRGGVLVAVVAIIAVVALIVVTNMQNNAPIADKGPVPANMNTYGGAVIGKDGKLIPPAQAAGDVDKTTISALPTAAPTAMTDLSGIGVAATAKGKPVQVVIYLDFMCPFCNDFEKTNSTVLKDLANAGSITYEYRPITILDSSSAGTNYSSRAAAAAAAVAATAPDKYVDFVGKLYENQPQENSTGLTNDQLKQFAKDLGANIDSAVDSRTYRPLVAYTNQLALAHGLKGTPTILVDGQTYQGTSQTNYSDFKDFVQSVITAKNK